MDVCAFGTFQIEMEFKVNSHLISQTATVIVCLYRTLKYGTYFQVESGHLSPLIVN